MRLHGAISYLHAADARYHDDCRGTFMAPRSIKAAATANNDNGSMAKDTAFETVVNVMNSDVSHIWTSIETHSLYLAHGGCLSDYFGKDMIVLYATGLASLLIFRSTASMVLRIEDDNDDDLLVGKIAKQILNESKDSYNTRIDNDVAAEDVSSTLLSLLSKIDKNLEYSLPAILIGNIITSIVNNRPTTLKIALGIVARSKSLIEHLYI